MRLYSLRTNWVFIGLLLVMQFELCPGTWNPKSAPMVVWLKRLVSVCVLRMSYITAVLKPICYTG